MDLISRQAVIDLIGGMNMCDELSNETYKKLSASIDLLPSTQEWIPCDERLPDKEGLYLTTLTNFMKDNHVDIHYFRITKEGGRFDSPKNRNYAIVAWMPLTDPYKE